jgi:hypothetical protein
MYNISLEKVAINWQCASIVLQCFQVCYEVAQALVSSVNRPPEGEGRSLSEQ